MLFPSPLDYLLRLYAIHVNFYFYHHIFPMRETLCSVSSDICCYRLHSKLSAVGVLLLFVRL